ncbi:TIGR03936 family radical SAM-associated protein [Aquihabitans sp. McL0605]|uniref:TIGR03936 family radical SAM-associated protein n=1 Tax=Aquihabitans sp. McL0605 TaxID=3415671 RepID=UPI003CF89C6C
MRVRIRFTKTGKIRWTSHRDLARVWERVIRRVGLPVAYSQGFSPHPKLHFGLALSTGHESVAEFIDIDLDDDAPNVPSPAELLLLPPRITAALPIGLQVTGIGIIPTSTDSLQQAVVSCEWDIEVREVSPQQVAPAIERVLAADELTITRQRKGKDVTDDVRPYVLDLAVVGPTDGGTQLHAHLATQPRGLRVSELLALLDPAWDEGLVRRTHQWTLIDGARIEPLEGPSEATSTSHATARAS